MAKQQLETIIIKQFNKYTLSNLNLTQNRHIYRDTDRGYDRKRVRETLLLYILFDKAEYEMCKLFQEDFWSLYQMKIVENMNFL